MLRYKEVINFISGSAVLEKEKHNNPIKKKKLQSLYMPKEVSSHDPLEIYLKEIRKTQLLNHKDETSWATIVWNNKQGFVPI